MQDYINGKQQLYERLEKMIQNQSEDSEINFLVDSLRVNFYEMEDDLTTIYFFFGSIQFRLGANGKDKIQGITNSFKQIGDSMYPQHMKYLLNCAAEGF